jgi:signal transduction histidine kinase
MRLAGKLLFLLLTVIFLLLGVYAFLSVRREVALIHTDMRRDALHLGQTVRGMFLDVWNTSGPSRALELIEDTNRDDSRVRIRWVWLDEVPSDGPYRPAIDPADLRPVGEEGEGRYGEKDGFLYTYVAVRVGPDRLGALELAESLAIMHTYARSTIVRAVVLAAVIALVTGSLVALLGVRMVGRPVRDLIDKVRRMGAGDLEGPLRLHGHDELAEVAREMNVMCDRLAASRERVSAETAARIAALEQLRHADRLKTAGRLASGIAHELGTPLNVVSATAEVLGRPDTSREEVAEGARVIRGQVDRMAGIIRQFLDFARPSPPKKEAADLRGIVRMTVDLLGPMTRKRNVGLRIGAGDRTPLVHVDSRQIQQVLTNLLVNAIHASPAGSEVEIDLREESGRSPDDPEAADRKWVVLSVRDRGTGIAPEHLDRVFDPFFSTKSAGEGTGLGLSIAQGIARDHGGWIDVASQPDEGSLFTLHLPAETDA